MKNAYQQQQLSHIDRILANLPGKSDAGAEEFTRQFYAKMPVIDLEKLEPKRAAALSVSARAFIQKRDSSAPKIRIFSPKSKEHGYNGNYTVIELLNDDMPFLVDSLSSELARQGFTVRETIHPILQVVRDSKGMFQHLATGKDAKAKHESLIHFEISTPVESIDIAQLTRDLEAVLTYIRVSVEDWRAIVSKASECLQDLEKMRKHFDAETIHEVEDFMRWLVNRNFVFLGYAEYNFFDAHGKESLSVVEDSKLGVLKIEDDEDAPHGLEALPPQIRHFLLVPQLIEITKSNRKSLVHRSVPMDYIGLKRFDARGNIIGEARFLGLFTSNVYYQSAEMIPFVRQKIARALEDSNFDPVSHDGKSLKAILEFLPRDEIFQMSQEDLFEVSMGILVLEAKPSVRVFIRRDAFERFVSAMAFVPREQFSTDLRRQIQEVLEKALNGTTSAFTTQITEAPLTRLHLIIKTTPGKIPQVDVAAIEQEIAKRAYLWADLLHEALTSKYPEQKADKWYRAYLAAFPQNYINRYDAMAAAYDIKQVEEEVG